MSSIYPGAIDTTLAPAGKTNSTPMLDDHPDHHNLLADALEKVETELGPDPSGLYTSVAARLNALTYYGSTPPGSPTDGDEWVLPFDASAGVMWRFRYRAASASAYKWEFVGGPPAYFQDAGGTSTVRSAWFDLASIARIIVPRAGDYIAIGSSSAIDTAASQVGIGLVQGAVNPVYPAYNYLAGANFNASLAAQFIFTGLASGAEVRMRHASFGAAGTSTWPLRVLSVTPVRVS